jgi:hypothetical protein
MDECGICYDELDSTNIVIFPCHAKHKMHLTCYNDCLDKGYSICPFCRVDINVSYKEKNLVNDINFHKKHLKIIIYGIIFLIGYLSSIQSYIYIQKQKVQCDELMKQSYIDLSDLYLNGQCCVPELAIKGECEHLPNHIVEISNIYMKKFNKICETVEYKNLDIVLDYIFQNFL